MASLLQPPVWFSSSCHPNTQLFSTTKPTTALFRSPFTTSLTVSTSEPEPDESVPGPVDPVKAAFEKAKAYKKLAQSKPGLEIEQNLAGNSGIDGGNSGHGSDPAESAGAAERKASDGRELPDSVKLAMEKAKEYRKNKDLGSKEQKGTNSAAGSKEESGDKKKQLVVSSIDFVGLSFSDKKSTRGLPPGLRPVVDNFSDDDIAEVEIIVGDASKFGGSKASTPPPTQEDDSDLYKPKVSTWGVFPRPANISKTYGGGRVIRPGDELETAEERAKKDARTRELLAAYQKKIGQNIEPKLKEACEKALEEGDSLMDAGKLKEALPYYEKVMNQLPFQTELHGLAALQWSICQDSLTRRSEAQTMYEKLQSHPSPKVYKKARQFAFSFQAMEMMKVRSSMFSLKSTGYQDYFEAFIEKKNNYTSDEEEARESALSNIFPYIAFLLSPILLVLLVAIQKGR